MRQLVQRGMQIRAVQALVVVLDDQLPVGFDVVNDALAPAQVFHPPCAELCGKCSQLRRQAAAAFGSRLMNTCPAQVSAATRLQRVVVLAEVRHFVHVRRADQASVEVVGPRVIWALDAAAENAIGLGAEPSPAMTADVVERVHARRAARDDDALAEQLADDEPSGPIDLFLPSRVNPHAREQPIHLAIEEAAIDVVLGWERPSRCRHDLPRFDTDLVHGVDAAQK